MSQCERRTAAAVHLVDHAVHLVLGNFHEERPFLADAASAGKGHERRDDLAHSLLLLSCSSEHLHIQCTAKALHVHRKQSNACESGVFAEAETGLTDGIACGVRMSE